MSEPEARVTILWLRDTRDRKAGTEYNTGLASAKQLVKEGLAKLVGAKSAKKKPPREDAPVMEPMSEKGAVLSESG